MTMSYCGSRNIRELLIFANFAGRIKSRIKESLEIYFYNSTTKIYENSRIINFVQSPIRKKSREM